MFHGQDSNYLNRNAYLLRSWGLLSENGVENIDCSKRRAMPCMWTGMMCCKKMELYHWCHATRNFSRFQHSSRFANKNSPLQKFILRFRGMNGTQDDKYLKPPSILRVFCFGVSWFNLNPKTAGQNLRPWHILDWIKLFCIIAEGWWKITNLTNSIYQISTTQVFTLLYKYE